MAKLVVDFSPNRPGSRDIEPGADHWRSLSVVSQPRMCVEAAVVRTTVGWNRGNRRRRLTGMRLQFFAKPKVGSDTPIRLKGAFAVRARVGLNRGRHFPVLLSIYTNTFGAAVKPEGAFRGTADAAAQALQHGGGRVFHIKIVPGLDAGRYPNGLAMADIMPTAHASSCSGPSIRSL